jgi:NAD(P)-dependent dehydrogenase (short-subunit alcohol dehydrogenase family)
MEDSDMTQVFLVTGSSRGLGREIVEAALAAGHYVVATARKAEQLADLVDAYGDQVRAVALDVTDPLAAEAAVRTAVDAFGRLDVVVNNAGYGQFGMIEELGEAEFRAQLETNVFGAMWVTQAALPFLREQRSGHFLQVSSIGGICAFPGIGAYHASKWALEGFSQSLAQEVKDFGIRVTIIEPGGFSTDWGGSSAQRSTPLPAYAEMHQAADAFRSARTHTQGDPGASANAVLKLVDADQPPLRVFFGDGPLELANTDYQQRLATWRAWEWLSSEAQG